MKVKKIIKSAVKIAIILIILLVFLLVGLFFAIKTPKFQTFIAQKVTNSLSKQIGLPISIDEVNIDFFNTVNFEKLYVEDLNQDTLFFINHTDAKLSYFSLFQKKIELNQINIEELELNIIRNYADTFFNIDKIQLPLSNPNAENSSSKAWDVALSELLISKTKVNFLDYHSGNLIYSNSEEISLVFSYFKMGDFNIELEASQIYEPDVRFEINEAHPDYIKPEKDIVDFLLPVYLESASLNIENGKFSLLNSTLPEPKTKFKSNAIVLNEIQINTKDFVLAYDSIFTQLEHLSAKEQSGFYIKEMSSLVSFSNNLMELKQVNLETGNSKIQTDANLSYSSLADFGNFIEDVRFDLNLQPSLIHTKDLAYFIDLKAIDYKYPINIRGNIYGKVSSFKSKDLKVRSYHNTIFEGDFSMNGLPDIKQTFISGKVDRLVVDYDNLLRIYPDIPLPKNIQKLGKLNFNGRFDGFIRDFVANGYLETDLGSLYTDVNFKLDNLNNASYSGNVELNEFALGSYFDLEDLLGEVSLKAKVKGGGIKLSTLDVEVEGDIEKIDFKGYTYNNIHINGHIADKLFEGDLKIDEENIALDFKGAIDATSQIPTFDFEANIRHFNPKALNLWNKDLIIQAKLKSNFSASTINDVVGDVLIQELKLTSLEEEYYLGDFNITSRSLVNGEKSVTLISKDIDANVEGSFDFAKIPNAFKSVLIPNFKERVKDQFIRFEVRIKENPEFLKLLIPELEILKPSIVDGNINSNTQSILAKLDLPVIQYKDFSIFNVNSNIYVDQGNFDVINSIPLVYLKDSILVKDFSFLIQGEKNNLDLKLFADGAKNSSIELFANMITKNKRVKIVFEPSNIFINNQIWMIDENNEILISERISSKNLKLYNGISELLLNLELGIKEQKADVYLSNIFIQDFTQFLATKDIELKGVANGRIGMDVADDTPGFYGDLIVENIEVNDYEVGNLNASAVLDLPNKKVKLNGNLYGKDNEVNINGSYSFNKKSTAKDFDLHFDIQNFAIYSIEDFIAEYIDNAQGTVKGELSLTGYRDKPNLLGFVDINDVTTTVTFLQTTYNIKNQRVFFEKNAINLGKDLFITDIDGNIAYGAGAIRHNHLKDFSMDIDAWSEKIMGLNTLFENNQDFYGKAYINGSVAFKGPVNDMYINVKGESEGDTQISIPLTEGENASEYEFYSFIEKKKKTEEEEFIVNIEDKIKIKGVTVNLDLDLDNDAKLYIILDQSSGDVLEVKGEGNIKINVPKGAEVEFYGTYYITDGDYLFTLQNIVNKRFRIEPNSSINFQGRIEDSQVNVDAVYNLRAAPKNLIEDYLSLSPNSEQVESEANNRVPVKLLLALRNSLFNPDIAFDIEITQVNPILRNYIDRKIITLKQYENEMNRQVFSLLVLNQFLPPLSSLDQVTNGININANDAANTVSEFLSNQITRYFNDWLSYFSDDISLNFNYRNYESDATTATSLEDLYLRRELQLALTTKFFNDRITVNLGGNVDFGENQLGVDNANTTFFGGNASLEYALTENRRFRIKAFTTTDYDYFNQSNATRAGVGISFKREFNSIKDIKISKEEFKIKSSKKDTVGN